jgi:hypothetical protein
MGKSELNNFYYNLLNIGSSNQDKLTDIANIIEKNKQELSQTTDYEGLCKIFSNNISLDLKEKEIDHRILNTLDLGSNYEHVFVVAFYKTQDLNYVLIDPTFIQFASNQNKQLIAFNEWPSDTLKQTLDGEKLSNKLIESGYSLVDNNIFNKYLNIFNNLEHTLALDEVLISEHKTVPTEISKSK